MALVSIADDDGATVGTGEGGVGAGAGKVSIVC